MSDVRELRQALEKAQADLKATKRQLAGAQQQQVKLDQLEKQLAATRRQLTESLDREHALAAQLDEAKKASQRRTEPVIPTPPVDVASELRKTLEKKQTELEQLEKYLASARRQLTEALDREHALTAELVRRKDVSPRRPEPVNAKPPVETQAPAAGERRTSHGVRFGGAAATSRRK